MTPYDIARQERFACPTIFESQPPSYPRWRPAQTRALLLCLLCLRPLRLFVGALQVDRVRRHKGLTGIGLLVPKVCAKGLFAGQMMSAPLIGNPRTLIP